MVNYFLCGGIHKTGSYMEHEYDKLVLTVTTCEDTESNGNVFGFGTPVPVKLKTSDVLKSFGLGSFSEFCLLKFPVPVRLFFNSSRNGFFVSGIQPIKRA